jgi:hypothetical protein
MFGCSSGPKKGEHVLHRILLYNLHFRRPPQLGASPSAVIGEEEYVRQPKPNLNLDCEPYAALFKGIQLQGLRECLLSSSKLQGSSTINYTLKPEVEPYLLLEKTDNTPDCIKQTLEKIPVPREIFFQSNDEGPLSCYNSRIEIVENFFGRVANFRHRIEIQIRMPLSQVPKTDEQTLMLLQTWAMSPFFKEGEFLFFSKVVPDEICMKCMGRKNMFSEIDSLPPLWPNAD